MRLKIAILAALAVFAASPVLAQAVNVVPAIQCPAVSGSAYSTGNVLGGIQSFIVPGSGVIQNASISFATGTVSSSTDLLLFTTPPTGGGTTDRAAVAITVLDMPKNFQVIHVTDCTVTATAASLCQAQNVSVGYHLAPGNPLIVVPVIRGSATFTNPTDVCINLSVIQ